MKNIKNILSVLVVMFAMISLYSCKDDAPVYEPAEKLDGTSEGVFFPNTNKKAFELEPTEATQITLTIARSSTAGAIDVPITVELNTDEVFVAPTTISFADGEAEKNFTVNFPNAKEGITYSLRLSVQGDQYVNTYSSAIPYVSAEVTRIKWEATPEPLIYVDGTFSAFYGVGIHPMYVEAEKAKLGTSVRYRMKNVYKVPTEVDADGIYNGYPYNEPGDVDTSKDYYTIIEISDPKGLAGEVFMPAHDIGVIWSYGMFSIGSIYKNVSQDKAKYPLGVLKNEVITFPASSLFISMATYKSGEKRIASTPTIIYLTKEAFIAANNKIEDFNDLEYVAIPGEVGEFKSDTYDKSWNQTLSKAIDIDEENKDSEYKNLYYLSDLYAEDYGLAFYYDEEDDKLKVVDNQKIGTKVFGKDIYVSQSTEIKSLVTTNDKGVKIYTFGLMFHYKDGTSLGSFEELYFYSKDPVSYAKTDFLGNFKMTGPSQFVGVAPANMDVKIAEGADANTFVITGIDYAKEVKATFDETKSTISVKPQNLADFVTQTATYDMTLLTSAGDDVSSTAAMTFTFNMEGKLTLTATSEADGYLIDSNAAGGYVDGYYDIVFTRIPAAKSPMFKANKTSLLKVKSAKSIVNKVQSKTGSHNFKILGKISPKKLKSNLSTDVIF